MAVGAVAIGLGFMAGCSGGAGSGGTGAGDVAGSALVAEVPRPEADPVPRDDPDPAAVVVDWMDLHLDLVRRESVSAPVATRVFANAAVAIAGAAALATGDQPLVIDGIDYPSVPDGADLNAAVVTASAAAEATRMLFPSRFARQSVDALEAHHYGSFSGDDESVLFGRQVADAVMARAATDGYDTVDRRRFATSGLPGAWEPTPPGFQRPLEPGWGELKPFVASDDDCPVADPVPYSEDPNSAFFAEAMAVYNTDAALTDEQVATARYWNDRPGFTFTPSGHWVFITAAELDAERADTDTDVSLVDAATTYALLSVAQADAFIANWVVKYRTDVVRPVTYLRNLVDPDWLPVLNTPPFPEYPSGHSTGSAAAATVLTSVFGDREFTDSTHEDLGWPARTYSSFGEAATEASVSRRYGGIHYPMGSVAGEEQGVCLAGVVLERLARD